jgi:hypothetical protein
VEHHGADGNGIRRAGDDLTDRATIERLAELEGRHVGRSVVHSAPHVGVNAHHGVAYQDLARL